MSGPESFDSPQVKLIREWGQAFTKRDMGLVTRLLHKDYRSALYPRSLDVSEETREEWISRFSGIISLWTDVDLTFHSIIETPGKVVVHLTNNIKTSLGVEGARESIFIVHIVTDEDGSLKIKQIEDFTDSKARIDFLQAVAAAKAKK